MAGSQRKHRLICGRTTTTRIGARILRRISDRQLVERCILYEDSAWHELIRRYGRTIYTAVASELAYSASFHERTALEDIVRRVFEKLLERNCEVLRTLDDQMALQAYLCQIARMVTFNSVNELQAQGATLLQRPRRRLHGTKRGTKSEDICTRLEEVLAKRPIERGFF